MQAEDVGFHSQLLELYIQFTAIVAANVQVAVHNGGTVPTDRLFTVELLEVIIKFAVHSEQVAHESDE